MLPKLALVPAALLPAWLCIDFPFWLPADFEWLPDVDLCTGLDFYERCFTCILPMPMLIPVSSELNS